MEKRYLMTQSLLSAWLYQYNCAEGYEEEARESFLKTLRREPTESSESMERGIAFEDAVYEVICGNKTAAAAYASQWSKRGEEVPEGACILELAEQLSGGIYQLTAYKEKTISGERFLLMAKCDWVSEDKETTVYLNDDVADICSEGEPGFDPTHMINCLKIRYEEAKRIYNKKQ